MGWYSCKLDDMGMISEMKELRREERKGNAWIHGTLSKMERQAVYFSSIYGGLQQCLYLSEVVGSADSNFSYLYMYAMQQ